MNLELGDQKQNDDSVTGVADQDPATTAPSKEETPQLGLDEYLANGYDYEVPKRGDIREGTIIARDDGLIVDIGFKREGIVPAEDLTRLDDQVRSDIKVGDKVSVFVLRPANREGQPILSIHQARMYEDWIKVEKMMEDGELYEGQVTGYNRGGLIVKFGKIRGFVPASQIVGLPRRLREEQRRQRLEAMIGEDIGLKIIEVDRKRRRLIFSQRRALRAWQDVQRERVMDELVEGETRHGKVTSITNFGAFVDLGGADGLIHVSELSWSRVDNPHDVLKVGDEVDVYILNVDQERKRIALSLKKLQPDPWTLVNDHYRQGQLVEGRVTRVLDFGAFVELDLGIEGLLHVSEMIGTPELKPSDIVHPGEKLPVKIIRIESQRKRIALSAKQVRRDEWERWIAEQQTIETETEEVELAAEPIQADSETTEPEAPAAESVPVPSKEAAELEEVELAAEPVQADSETTEPEAPAAESVPVPSKEAAELEEVELAAEPIQADSETTEPEAPAAESVSVPSKEAAETASDPEHAASQESENEDEPDKIESEA